MTNEIQGNSVYGTETLEIIADAGNFNRWMFETIKPFCHGEILEVGSGIGNISGFFVDNNFSITLSDIENSYFPLLYNKFGANKNLNGVFLMDISDKFLEVNHPDLIGKFDTVFALNVVEHIPDHEQAMGNMMKLLKKGGKVIILVPAFQSLYNGFDRQLDHQRRYTVRSLKKLLENSDFRVVHSQYFNFMAIFGWLISGNILRKRMLPAGQMRFFNQLVPLWRFMDFFVRKWVGISIIQVGVKQ